MCEWITSHYHGVRNETVKHESVPSAGRSIRIDHYWGSRIWETSCYTGWDKLWRQLKICKTVLLRVWKGSLTSWRHCCSSQWHNHSPLVCCLQNAKPYYSTPASCQQHILYSSVLQPLLRRGQKQTFGLRGLCSSYLFSPCILSLQ